MPYHEGRKVSNEEWLTLTGKGQTVGWKEATGWQDPSEPEPEPEPEAAPKRAKRAGTKKAEANAALAAITGLDLSLDDEDDLIPSEEDK